MNRIKISDGQKNLHHDISSSFNVFFSTHGIRPVEDDAQVIHYIGEDVRDLIDIYKKNNPDVIIIHNEDVAKSLLNKQRDLVKMNYIIDITNDLNVGTEIRTNVATLATLYYRRLGLNRIIIDDTEIINNLNKKNNKTFILKIVSIINRIKEIMIW